MIVVQNWKLGLLLKLLQIGIFALIFSMVVIQEAWLKEIPQADFQGGLTFWASPSSLAEYTGNTTHDLKQDWCVNPEKFNYQYDENFAFHDYSCIGMPPHERWIKGETELYVPVSFHEQYMWQVNLQEQVISQQGGCQAALSANTPCAKGWNTLPRGLDLLGCECELSGGNYFVAGVSALTLGMELFFNVKSGGGGETEGFSTKATTMENGIEKPGMLVVLQDQHGQTVEKYKPGGGRAVQIPVLHLLKHSGANLDDTMDNTLENLDKKATLKYPSLRMTGVTISAHITYMNHHNFDWEGPVGVIGLSHQKIWSRKSVTQHDKPLAQVPLLEASSFQQGQYRFRHYSGIRIKFSASGIWKEPDAWNLLGTIGQSIPYMYIPILIVGFVALNCLGPLAQVYKRAGQQKVGLAGHKGNAAVRMVVAANAYNQLKGEDHHLSQDVLQTEMQRILQDSEVDIETSNHIVQQMFQEMDVDKNNHVSLQEFMEAAIGHDLIGPAELAACHHQGKSMSFAKKALFSEGSRVSVPSPMHSRETKVVPA